MNVIEHATRNLFFTGKGGVGKTTISSATAIALADKGYRVLLVSTDPASNLNEVLGTTIESQPTAVRTVSGLFAVNVDPEQAAAGYRERTVGPYRGVLPQPAIAQMEEQLSGACTMEIAAFDEFAKLLGDPATTQEFDHIVFDTAPTGHTLRLLDLPGAWSDFMENNTGGTSCLGPLSVLKPKQHLYTDTRKALVDGNKTTLVLVSRPDPSALSEAFRTYTELKELGVNNQQLIINGVFFARNKNDPVAASLAKRLAQEGFKVHLSTTDPAAHIAAAVGNPTKNIQVSRIDPKAETRSYAKEVMATVGQDLDDQGRALLAEDLRSPCTEEIAVFHAFSRIVSKGKDSFVVIDTAPTGHTLLLLDAAKSFHREVSRSMHDLPESVRQLLPRLRDPDYTQILLVTLPEATPVHEAAALEKDLRRAGIEPFAWVINQCLSQNQVSDPILLGRQAQEGRYIDEVRHLAERLYLVPWMPGRHDSGPFTTL